VARTLKKIVVDTDILLDHLTGHGVTSERRGPSVLRQVMAQMFCYTTVFNAIELFSLCKTAGERVVVEDVMHSMKILGLNGKSAKNVGMYLGQLHSSPLRDMEILIAGLCTESRLPILTGRPHRYRAIRSLRVVTPDRIVASHKKGVLWS